MAQKPNKKNGRPSSAASSAGGAALLPEETERVRELIAGRHSKSALQLAKDIYKRSATAESEALLVDAYKARSEDLLKLGMTVEAKSLLGIVRERFPATLQRLAELDRRISALDGRLEEVVGPLRDPNLAAESRERIETFVRQHIYDLPALATVSSLPPDHALRVAASALANAFQAVTDRPVTDAIVTLPEVSRRSPLAPWKALSRAIACYYRGEDAECGKWLRTIPGDSIPARLIPALTAMLGKKTEPKLSLADKRLIAAAGDHGAALRPALADLDKALRAKKQKPILDAARAVVAASEDCAPELRERLRQNIIVRSIAQRIQLPVISAALGAPPRLDAYYYRLMARSLEDQQNFEANAEALLVWLDFRRAAIQENWFAAGGLEDGVLALHMAQEIEKLPDELIEEMKFWGPSHRKSAKRDRLDKDQELPSADALYERACLADPHPEAFQMWLSCARKHGSWKDADSVAERWRKARSTDIQPLLYLMESSEKRNAFKKALKYLEEAEELDRLNPEVRRAKLRLLLFAAMRHLDQRKTHLAQGEIEQIAAVPEVRSGEVAALATALRWCSAAVDDDKATLRQREAELEKAVGSVAAHLLITALLKEANLLFAVKLLSFKAATIPDPELLVGAVKACALGEWSGLPIELPKDWNGPLIAALNLPNCPVDAAQTLVLGETALASFNRELAYAISTAGLSSFNLAGGGANARFLFLRARSLPDWAQERREGCFTAALELARRERNTDLAGKILDGLKMRPSSGSWQAGFNVQDSSTIASRPVSPELLSKILDEELKLKQFPVYGRNQKPKYAAELVAGRCDCPRCRAKRGEPVGGPFEYMDDDEDDDDFDEEDDFVGPGSPSDQPGMEMLEALLDGMPPAFAPVVRKALADGLDPITIIENIMGKAFPIARGPSPRPVAAKKKEKAAKAARPGQGSLF